MKIYKDASDKAFIVDNLKSGFQDSGICPIDFDLAVKNWQEDHHHSQRLNASSTPPEFQINYEVDMQSIPQNSRDVYRRADAITRSFDHNDRFFRDFVKACGRAIDEKNAERALLKEKYAASKAALEAEEKSLGIFLDPDETFDPAEEIIPACETLTERSQEKDSTPKKTDRKKKISTIGGNNTVKRLNQDSNC